MPEIITKRLRLCPLSEAQLGDLIDQYAQTAPELSEAYRQMRAACQAEPSMAHWHAPWSITLQSNGAVAGYLGFQGRTDNSAELGYGLNDGFTGFGYATEAVAALCGWAFSMPGIRTITAETAPDNAPSQRVLLRCGFVPTGAVGAEGPRFSLSKPTAEPER